MSHGSVMTDVPLCSTYMPAWLRIINLMLFLSDFGAGRTLLCGQHLEELASHELTASGIPVHAVGDEQFFPRLQMPVEHRRQVVKRDSLFLRRGHEGSGQFRLLAVVHHQQGSGARCLGFFLDGPKAGSYRGMPRPGLDDGTVPEHVAA